MDLVERGLRVSVLGEPGGGPAGSSGRVDHQVCVERDGLAGLVADPHAIDGARAVVVAVVEDAALAAEDDAVDGGEFSTGDRFEQRPGGTEHPSPDVGSGEFDAVVVELDVGRGVDLDAAGGEGVTVPGKQVLDRRSAALEEAVGLCGLRDPGSADGLVGEPVAVYHGDNGVSVGEDADRLARWCEYLEAGGNVYRYDGEIPCNLLVFDGTVAVGGHPGEGEPSGLVESDDEAVLAWGLEVICRYQRDAERLTPESLDA